MRVSAEPGHLRRGGVAGDLRDLVFDPRVVVRNPRRRCPNTSDRSIVLTLIPAACSSFSL